MNTILGIIVGLFVFAVALAPLAAQHIQRNGLTWAINENSIVSPVVIFPHDQGSSNVPGLIYAANESRFTVNSYDQAVTGYVVGWRDPENLTQLLEDLFPAVQVGRRFNWKSAPNSMAFLTIEDDVRGIGASFTRIETRGKSEMGQTLNRGLTTRVDKDEENSSDVVERKSAWLRGILERNSIRRGFALLETAATAADLTWDETSNPDGDLRGVLRGSTDVSGVRPNQIVWGELAWDARLDVYEGQDTPYAGRAASMTPEALASKLLVDRNLIVKARYQSTPTDKEPIVPSKIYAYTAFKGADKDDPTNIKRFVSNCHNGKRWAVYVEDHPKFIDVTVEHYDSTYATSAIGMTKSAITNSVGA